MERLFVLFDRFKPLSPDLKAYILSVLKKKECKKKTVLLQEGNIAKAIFFIDKGLIRSFRHEKGREKTPWIMKAGDIFVSISSFFTQTPALESIEAIEDCVLYYITFDELQYAYEKFPKFNLHGRLILQYYYKLSEDRNSMREQSARYKFEYLMTRDTDLVGRVQDKYLASYIGVTPSTFSLQKRLFAKRNRKK